MDIVLLISALLAGILTVAAPCILPLLPVIVGGGIVTASDDAAASSQSWRRPLVIVASLGVSIFVFTLLLKASTALLGVPQEVWRAISGTIVILLGIAFVWPGLWGSLEAKVGFFERSNKLAGQSYQHKSTANDIVLGAALGPVFNSCSPTYLLIVAVILPAAFLEGIAYLTAYTLGLCLTLLLIALAGRSVVQKLGWLANARGILRRTIGIVFILVGAAVILGLDSDIQTYVLDRGWYNPIAELEKLLR